MKLNTKQLVLVSLMTALMCILGPLSITLPFTSVPISFTNLIVFLAIAILGYKLGTLSYLIYLLLGLAGLPIFSNFTGGASKLLGPTGGYLIGFIFMELAFGIIIHKFGSSIPTYIIGMVLGTIIVYIFGTAWLAYQMGSTFVNCLFIGVVPFILGDVLKIAIITIICPVINKSLEKANLT